MDKTEAALIKIAEQMESFAEFSGGHEIEKLNTVVHFGLLNTLTEKYTEQSKTSEAHQNWDCY